nr:unnamed protein product [Callosobruchus chinensis]
MYEERKKIHKQFWTDQKSIDVKRQFIASHVQQLPIERRRERTSERKNKRQYTNRYTFESKSRLINIPAISKKREGGILSPDKRGKHGPANKIPAEVRIIIIRWHISEFPTYESHYSRERSKKRYLSNHLSISRMYQLYLEYCKDNKIPEEIKLKLQEATEDNRLSIQQAYDNHLTDASNRYKMKKADKEHAKENDKQIVLMIDLQKCSPTPEPHNSQTLDLLVIHNSTEGRAYCMMWDESISAVWK